MGFCMGHLVSIPVEGVAADLHCLLSFATYVQWASWGRGLASLCFYTVPKVLWL